MKYILSESRLKKFVLNYLDNFLESKRVYYTGPYIVIEENSGDEDDYDLIPQYMEFDHSDGRLWIKKTFIQDFSLLFPFTKKQTEEIIVPWFEDKFLVDVEYVVE